MTQPSLARQPGEVLGHLERGVLVFGEPVDQTSRHGAPRSLYYEWSLVALRAA